MKKYLFVLAILLASMSVRAQVTSEPAFPTGDESIKIIIDLKLSQDGRVQGLLGQTDGIYLWSGAGRTTDQSGAFEFGPEGQTNFNQAFEPGAMTSEGNDVWSITLTPRSFYGVPDGVPIRIIGMVVKNTDGSAQTENFYLELSDGAFEVRFTNPSDEQILAALDEVISIEVESSKAADLSLTVDGQTQPLKEVADATALVYDYTVTETGSKTFTVTANDGNEIVEDSFSYFVPAQNTVAELPQGIQLGINYTSATSATLVLDAPGKEFIHVIGEFNNWELDDEYQMNLTPGGDMFWIALEGLTEGQEYLFQYLVDGQLRVGDPYSEKVSIPGDFGDAEIISNGRYQGLKSYPSDDTQFVVSYLQTGQQAYAWQNDNFDRPDVSKLVVYELLVRDFDDRRTYDAVRERLSYIKSLGVNAIELMPIMQFDGNLSWGYNPTFMFAPDKYYGTEEALKRLIDEAHGMGMAVILDMVLNHAWGPSPLVRLFNEGDYGRPTTDNPWLNQEPKHPFNVGYDFNHESERTQAYVDSVNRYWLTEYRFDGLRFDLSKGFTQVFTGNDVGAWNAYDASRVTLLKRMYDHIRSYDDDAYIILEHLGGSTEERELANYGMMLWANFNHQFRDLAAGGSSNFNSLSYFGRGWNDANLMAYMESHDEERLMWEVLNFGETTGDVNLRQLDHAVDRLQMLAAFFFGVPGSKMMWQFGEFGYDEELNSNNGQGRTDVKPTRWEYLENSERQRLLKFYQSFLPIREENDVFQTEDLTISTTNLIKRLILRDDDMDVFIVGNFGLESITGSLEFPSTGTWYDYFTGDEIEITDVDQEFTLAMSQYHILTTEPLTTPESGISRFSLADVVTGIEDTRVKANIRVYPSPTEGKLVLNLKSNFLNGFDLKITDLLGREIGHSKLELIGENTYETELSSDAYGILIVSVENNLEIARKKIIKR